MDVRSPKGPPSNFELFGFQTLKNKGFRWCNLKTVREKKTILEKVPQKVQKNI